MRLDPCGNPIGARVVAVVFDIDGTLIDSVQAHAEAWRLAFERYGREVPREKVREQIGKGGDQLVPVFLYPDEVESFGEELEEWRGRLFKERFLPHVRAFPGVRDLFQRLRYDRKAVALASSAKPDELDVYVRAAGVEDLFVTATSSGDARRGRSKPHPDIVDAALERLGRPDPRATIMVGDSPYDALAARALGVATYGVLTGGFTAAELREAGCARVFRDVRHLLEAYPFERAPVAAPALTRGAPRARR